MNITSYTSLSSRIVQNNLTQATNGLNTAIERLSTGFKINHAKDNAANYSISNSMSSKISSYNIAEENAMMGLDMVQTAGSAMDEIAEKTERLRYLAEQAQNGTYGEDSIRAMNQEAAALVNEIERISEKAEYNGQKLFGASKSAVVSYVHDLMKSYGAGVGFGISGASGASGAGGGGGASGAGGASGGGAIEPSGGGGASGAESASGAAPVVDDSIVGTVSDLKPHTNGFIEEIETVTPDIIVESADALAEAIANNSIIGIANADVLHKLATLVNSGTSCEDKTIVLTGDIDLSNYQAEAGWTAIGTESNAFNGTFDGQGHKITRLKINKPTTKNQGLFGYTGSSSEIKNIGIVDCDIKGGKYTGGLVGRAYGYVTNCYATGTVTGTSSTGGLVGCADGTVTKSYATGNVTGTESYTGGLVGRAYGTVTNCFAKGSITGAVETGGLVGTASDLVVNCYAICSVIDIGNASNTGGLVGFLYEGIVKNCYATGTVTCTGENHTCGRANLAAGGLVGEALRAQIADSFAMVDVINKGSFNWVENSSGGIVGIIHDSQVSNIYAFGSVKGESYVGCLVGNTHNSNISGGYSSGVNKGLGIVGSGDWTDEGIIDIKLPTAATYNFQIGINGDESSRISITYEAPDSSLSSILTDGIQKKGTLDLIDNYLSELNHGMTNLGAIENRLMSAIDQISTAYDNLVASRSTIRDADIGEVTSEYIKKQILQEASATLLATANQSPAIALQLI